MTTEYSFFWLMLFASIVAMLGRFIKLPYTIALVLAGLAVGHLRLLPDVHMEPHLLFVVFLPPVLFEAGINIRFRPLRQYWLVIGALAILGTFMSMLLIGYATHYLIGLPLITALLFGAIISPTDPISVISLFKKIGVSEKLALIIEAESLFNDGVAMVLFLLLQKFANTGNTSVTQGVADFCFTVLGGAGIGIILGSVASRITREYDDHLIEITLTTIVAFGSYLAAEYYHVSGVIAVVAASVVVGNYGMTRGMSPASRQSVLDFWEYAAFVANSIVFLLIGIEIANVSILSFAMGIFIAVIVVLAARALCVYNLSALLHYAGFNIPRSWRHVMVWSGLRGALSMAMVLGVATSPAEYNQLVAMTFGVVLFSIVFQGLSLEPLLNRLGLRNENESMREHNVSLGEK